MIYQVHISYSTDDHLGKPLPVFTEIESARDSVLGQDSCLIMVATGLGLQNFTIDQISFKTKEMKDCKGGQSDNAPGISFVCKKRLGRVLLNCIY